MPHGVAPAREDGVKAVERALAILQSFREDGEVLSLAALAQRTALYKSTILRIAGSLVRTGFMHRDTKGSYMLGPEMRRLGALSAPKVDNAALIRAALARLVGQTRETASFYVRDGNERICLLRHNSPRSARHHLEEGARHPLGSGAAGQVLLAFAGAQGRAAVDVRRNGWAASLGARDPDLAAIAVPLRDANGAVLGALTISGLLSRFSPEFVDAAQKILLEETASLRTRLSPNANWPERTQAPPGPPRARYDQTESLGRKVL